MYLFSEVVYYIVKLYMLIYFPAILHFLNNIQKNVRNSEDTLTYNGKIMFRSTCNL